eukprot:scaffold6337_cov126-Skeletonema_marinoi.AAC.3
MKCIYPAALAALLFKAYPSNGQTAPATQVYQSPINFRRNSISMDPPSGYWLQLQHWRCDRRWILLHGWLCCSWLCQRCPFSCWCSEFSDAKDTGIATTKGWLLSDTCSKLRRDDPPVQEFLVFDTVTMTYLLGNTGVSLYTLNEEESEGYTGEICKYEEVDGEDGSTTATTITEGTADTANEGEEVATAATDGEATEPSPAGSRHLKKMARLANFVLHMEMRLHLRKAECHCVGRQHLLLTPYTELNSIPTFLCDRAAREDVIFITIDMSESISAERLCVVCDFRIWDESAVACDDTFLWRWALLF